MFLLRSQRPVKSHRERTFNSLTLRQVAVLVLGEEASLVPPDDPLKEPVVYLQACLYVSEMGVLDSFKETHIEEESLHGTVLVNAPLLLQTLNASSAQAGHGSGNIRTL